MFQQNILLDLIEIVTCVTGYQFSNLRRLLILTLAIVSPIRFSKFTVRYYQSNKIICLMFLLVDQLVFGNVIVQLIECVCVFACASACVCVNYLRLNKHLTFSACIHSNLLSQYIYIHVYKRTYIDTLLEVQCVQCTPTHIHIYIHTYVCFVRLSVLFICTCALCFWACLRAVALCALYFVCLHNSHTSLQKLDARLTERAIECVYKLV